MAPYLHARLSAVKLAGDPNNPLRVWDDATADELRAEMMKRIAAMRDAGLIDLTALPAPNGRIGIDRHAVPIHRVASRSDPPPTTKLCFT
jgi:hypothetical protein